MSRDVRCCEVVTAHCIAPAGYRTGSGTFGGTRGCRGTCHCALPVCRACSRLTRRRLSRADTNGARVRVCADCWRERRLTT